MNSSGAAFVFDSASTFFAGRRILSYFSSAFLLVNFCAVGSSLPAIVTVFRIIY